MNHTKPGFKIVLCAQYSYPAVVDAMTRDACAELDDADPLGGLRAHFQLDDSLVYLDGNSLGALPVTAAARVRQVVEEQWGRGLATSWTDAGWMEAPERIGAKLAPLLGAAADEVIVCDSTSVNLFKVLGAALASRPERRVILTEHANFPTDVHVAEGLAELSGRGWEVRRVLRGQLEDAIDEGVGVLLLTHVDYMTGYVHHMRDLTAVARAAGVMTVWDLSHSAGAMPVDLSACGVDLAVGCGYKYLNGGPGAPAYIYVSRHVRDSLVSPIHGWMGHARPFDFGAAYDPAPGPRRFLAGTPSIIAMAALEAALDLWQDVDIAAIRQKSTALTETFIALVDARCDGLGLEMISPRPARLRGSHVALRHAQAEAVLGELRRRQVVGDFRPPDVMRFGFVPMYTRFTDAWDAVDALEAVLRPAGRIDTP